MFMAIWLTGEQVRAQPPSAPSAPSEAAPGPSQHVPTASMDDASPPTPEQGCIRAHEQAQLLRLDGALMQSRSNLKACSLEVCPAVVQRDCVRWLDEVSSQIPTVVFEAITETGDAQRVIVKQGNQLLARELDGRPLEMDPGYYEFRLELPGHAPKVVSVLLKQGEKNRLVSVDFRQAPEPPPIAGTVAPVPPPTPLPPRVSARSRPIPTSVYTLGGVSLVSAGAATILGINTKAKEDRAYEECAPSCPDERIDSIERWALATDVAIGVAIVSAVTATILYVRRPEVTELVPAGAPFRVLPMVGWEKNAGWAGVEGSF